MAAANEHTETQELNCILKCLGERGIEGELSKSFTQNVQSYMLQQLSKYGNSITFRLYGSGGEDLKCIAPDDIGDLDIVIIPKSDELMINDGLIEYLPQHPVHARIKGIDHPVLQSCLVEDTDYVATSALKNFHPAIYGTSMPHFIDNLTRLLPILSGEEWFKAISTPLENKDDCPALQLNYTQSLGSYSEQIEMMKKPQMLPKWDLAEWEWIFINVCRLKEIKYTKEHAEILDEYFEFANELRTSMHETSPLHNPQSFPIMFHELLFSDRAKHLWGRYFEIETRLQSEKERREHCLPKAEEHVDEQCVTPGNENESGSNGENILQAILPYSDWPSLTPKNADDTQISASSHSAIEDSSENRNCSTVHPISKEVSKIKEDTSAKNKDEGPDVGQYESNKQQQLLAEKGELIHKDLQYFQLGLSSSETDVMFDHIFAQETNENKPASKGTDEGTDKAPIKGGIDLVPALRSGGWPKVARKWIERERKWPSPDIVDKVIQEGFHLVVKPPKNGGNPDCDFRISFSHAEYLLSQEINDIQRECYRCLKKFHRAYLSTEPKRLVTFHLKNLFLHTIEETGAEVWTESNRAECVMKLLGKLLNALEEKDLRHFFVSSYNLFGIDYIESPEILDVLAETVKQIIKHPMHFTKELIQNEEALNQVKKEKCVPCSKPIAEKAARQAHEEQKETASTAGEEGEKQLTVRPVENDTSHQDRSSHRSYRFHDLKDIYLAISYELTNMAFSDAEPALSEALDPLERSLVQDLREMITNRHVQVNECREMFEDAWDAAYMKVWMNPEPNMRRRMLDAIHGVIETMKYQLRQDDLALENLEVEDERLHIPCAGDPFWSHLMPAGIGSQFLHRIFNNILPLSARTQEDNITEDIPLD